MPDPSFLQRIADRFTEARTFVRTMVDSPKKTGAVLPSSGALAQAMAKELDPQKPGYVIELGAGTGAITKGILKRGFSADRIIAFENNPKSARIFRKHFPDIRLLEEDAQELDTILKREGITQINGMVSSLPFRSLPKTVSLNILACVTQLLPSSAPFIQFTYGVKPPLMDLAPSWPKKRTATVFANVPPAHVWVYTQTPSSN